MRYAVVDLATMRIHREADDVTQALEELADVDDLQDEEQPRAQHGIIDLHQTELIEVDEGQIVRSWLDAFTGTWRRVLA